MTQARNSDMSLLQSFQSLSIPSTTIDFGRQFASNKAPEEFVAAVNQYLHLHNANKIEKLRIFFHPFNEFLQDIANWVTLAAAKRVEVLDLDLSMGSDPLIFECQPFILPATLFECKTLTSLVLSYCDFSLPPGFTSFDHLHSLSLTHVHITDDKLQHLLTRCPILDSLRIAACPSLESIKVHSQRLEKLTVVNPWDESYEIEIACPRLQSFIYYGEHVFGDSNGFSPKNPFVDISSLSAFFICSIGMELSEPEHDYIKLLSDLKQVKVLTVCTATLMRVKIWGEGGDEPLLPILLHNLKELQLLMNTLFSDHLSYVYGFFRLCPSPFIEKLFIRLSASATIPDGTSSNKVVEEPPEVAFNHLKAIKLINFKGCENEMRLVRFLLERAFVLETLVLVAPPKPHLKASMDAEQSHPESVAASVVMTNMISFYGQLSALPKASRGANIVICEYLEDDCSLTPTHTEYFSEFWEF